MTETMDKLRDKDEIVLQAIQQGNNDIQKITETTTLENHEVNYCFTKIEDLNLIHVEKSDGYTTRNINGQNKSSKYPNKPISPIELRNISKTRIESTSISG
ncbi:hypothetical protein [Halorubrum trueperi]|uniref:Uncharacterized protein n=1 Tax=Halorubrum trueperi TaxID=2004704 RepID=A0ABD5UG58_9EURY